MNVALKHPALACLATTLVVVGCGGPAAQSEPAAESPPPAQDSGTPSAEQEPEQQPDAADTPSEPSTSGDAETTEPDASATETSAGEGATPADGADPQQEGTDTTAGAGEVAAQPEDTGPDPLAELAALGSSLADTSEGGGSSRAKKDARGAIVVRQKDKRNILVKVEGVNRGRFPLVALRVAVRKPARKGPGKKVKKGTKLLLLPKLAFEGKEPRMNDEPTRLNAGSFFLRKGDQAFVRLGKKKDKTWEAEYIERK